MDRSPTKRPDKSPEPKRDSAMSVRTSDHNATTVIKEVKEYVSKPPLDDEALKKVIN
jgi:hypothetical protein